MTVSVALATYQGERFVAEQVASILAQTHPVDEVVVADDGSRDGTVRVIEQLLVDAGSAAPTLRVLQGGGGLGVAANFSRALAVVTGDTVLLSDQDDVWHPDRVAAAVAAFNADAGLDLLFGDAILVDANGAPTGHTLFGSLPVSADELRRIADGGALEVLVRRNIVTGATVAVRRRALQRALPVPPNWIHDEWLAVTSALAGRIGVLHDPLIDYRQHGGNAIGVRPATPGYRIGRMLESRGDRNRALARRSAELVRFAEASGVDDERMRLLRGKSAFESARAAFASRRMHRVAAVVRLARSGGYRRYASQGKLDIARDLLQKP